MKRVLSMLMVLCLSVTLFAGCGQEQSEVTDDGQSEFSYWVKMPSGLTSVYETMGEMSMYKELEKRTNVHINFIHPTIGQESEQFNLLIASMDLPDMVEYDWMKYPGGADKAINDNIIISLNDYMDDLPNFSGWLTKDTDYDKLSKTDAKQYFGFPSFTNGNLRKFAGLVLRKDWLDELNLEVPETIDELENVLTQFKEKKGAKTPFTTNQEFFSMDSRVAAIQYAFGTGKGLYLDKGKMKFGPYEKEYKEFVATMHRWYEKGLLDNDYSTNKPEAIDSKFLNGSAGVVYTSNGTGMGNYMNKMKDDPNFKLVAAQYPVLHKGDDLYHLYVPPIVTTPYLAITTACKNPKAVAKWADYLYSDEGVMLCNFGIEGDTYNMVDGKPVYTDKILKNPDGLSISEAMTRNFRSTHKSPGVNELEDYLLQFYQNQNQIDAMYTWNKYIDKKYETEVPNLIPTIEESDEIATLETEIFTYTDEMIIKFIRGTEPIENYDAFIDNLKKLNIDRYLEIQQAAYERYLKR